MVVKNSSESQARLRQARVANKDKLGNWSRLLDRWISYTATPAVFLCIAAGITLLLLLWVLMIWWTDITFTDLSIFLSAHVLLAGYFLNSAIQMQSRVRDRTFEFMSENRGSPDFVRSTYIINNFIIRNEKRIERKNISIQEVSDFLASGERDVAEVRNAIRLLGNFYEEMAISISYREVSESMLRSYYADMLDQFMKGLRVFLPAICNDPPIPGSRYGRESRPNTFSNAVALHARWEAIREADP